MGAQRVVFLIVVNPYKSLGYLTPSCLNNRFQYKTPIYLFEITLQFAQTVAF